MHVVLVSGFADVNINHFFVLEVHAVWRAVCELRSRSVPEVVITLLLQHYAADDAANRWRRDVLERIVDRVVASADELAAPPDAECYRLPPFSWDPAHAALGLSVPMVNPHVFATRDETSGNPLLEALGRHVRRGILLQPAEAPGWTILFVARRARDRVLYDAAARETPLEDALRAALPPRLASRLRVACFDDSDFAEQARAIAPARIVIAAHGAALTNLFVLPKGAHVFEVGMRRHWFCHPVCAAHLDGSLPYTTRCGIGANAPPTYTTRCGVGASVAPPYHKADYHNLALAFGMRYHEVLLEDGGPFLCGNPIGIANMYVDATALAARIERLAAPWLAL